MKIELNNNIAENEVGVSVLELLTVLFIISLISATVVSNIKEINRPLTNASFEITHYLRLVRARAISQTLHIKVAPLSYYGISAKQGDSCDTATTTISDLNHTLSNQTSLVSTSWTICFTPRGLTEESTNFNIRDESEHIKTVEIALGGGVRIQ